MSGGVRELFIVFVVEWQLFPFGLLVVGSTIRRNERDLMSVETRFLPFLFVCVL